MPVEDSKLLADFVLESNEHLAKIENQFRAVEKGSVVVDVNLVNDVYREIHSIKGAAGFLGLSTINYLSYSIENVLNKLRNRELAPTSRIVDTILCATDALQKLIKDVQNSNDVDVEEHIDALEEIANRVDVAMLSAAEPGSVVAPTQDPHGKPTSEETANWPNVARTITCGGDHNVNVKLNPASPRESATLAGDTAQLAPGPVENSRPAAFDVPIGEAEAKAAPAAEAKIWVAVGVLDRLMSLVGELVLSRNQLMQAISARADSGLESIAARLDEVTGELQASIVQAHMQKTNTGTASQCGGGDINSVRKSAN